MAIALDRATSKTMTLEEFFNYDDDTDAMYELEDGNLILITAESEINRRIAVFLFVYFVQQGIPAYRLSMKTEIVITGAGARSRFNSIFRGIGSRDGGSKKIDGNVRNASAVIGS